MTPKTNLITALNGETPQTTPFSIYDVLCGADALDKPAWRALFEQGLVLTWHVPTSRPIEHGTETSDETRHKDGHTYRIVRKKTPAGTVRKVNKDGWHHEDWIKEPGDYKVFQWIAQNTEIVADYDRFAQAQQTLGEWGLCLPVGGRTPAMALNVDIAGTERFCLDLAMEVPELFECYETMKDNFVENTRLMAEGPGQFVKWLENLTISMLGPQRYRDLLLNVYNECVPVLENAGKKVMVHYDGQLAAIAEDIAQAPFHIVESLTEPPEGDMAYDHCRRAWPDKTFWGNLNIDLYQLPPDQLKEQVRAKRQRAGKRALAFEVSEDLPANWQESIPMVLKTLEDLQ